jgi:hypothetical protein
MRSHPSSIASRHATSVARLVLAALFTLVVSLPAHVAAQPVVPPAG